jgi:transposase
VEHFAGLDVATKETVISVVDERGISLLETSVPSDPESIAAALAPFAKSLRRLGHEAGSLAPWLQKGLLARSVPAICLETIAVRAALKAQRNKTDVTDARGIAQMMRTGWFRAVHMKSDESYRLRFLLSQRRNLKRKFLDLENAIRQSLKAFGVKLSAVGRGQFEAVVREKIAHDPMLSELADAMLNARAALWTEYKRLHGLLVRITAHDPVCARFMAIPGVGPVTALSFKTAVDDPARFPRSRDVGAHFGLTPARYQSGDSVDRSSGISKRGDKEVRTALYEAASGLLVRSKKWSALRAWGLKIAKRSGHRKAVTALARRLAVTMLAMWRDGTEFDWGRAAAKVDSAEPAAA